MSVLPQAFRHLPMGPGRLFVRYWRRRMTLKGGILGLQGTAVYASLVLVAVHVERFLRFSQALRLAGFVVVHGLILGLMFRWLRRWLRQCKPSPVLAYEIEKELGCHDERLVSAFALLSDDPERGHAPGMQAHLAMDADAFVRDRQAHPMPRDRRLRIAGLLVVALLVLGAAMYRMPAYQFGLMLERFYRPLAELPRPAFTRITLGHFPNPVARGDDLTLAVRLDGWIARRTWVEFEDGRERMPMTRIGRDAFLHTIYDAQSDMAFRIRAGDGETAWKNLRVVDPPHVEALTIEVFPPAYSRLPDESFDQPEEVRTLVGSRVTTRIASSQDLALAQVQLFDHQGSETRLPLDFAGGVAEWTVERLEKDVRFRILLRNRHGFDNLDRQERRLLALADQPPRVRLDNLPELMRMYPTEERLFEADLEDDLGLVSAHASLLVNPNPEFPVEPRRREIETFDAAPRARRLLAPVSLDGLGVEPGDLVEVHLEAVDTGGTIGRSARVVIEVVSLDPGVEERQRVAFLMVLRQALGQRAAMPEISEVWPTERAAMLAERAAADAVVFPDLNQPNWRDELRRRLLLEQDMTDFHLYSDDLRTLNVLLSGRGLDDPDWLQWLAESYLPAQIQFRFHRNLNRVLIALAEVAGRLATPTNGGADTIGKQAVQLRASLEEWMAQLARVSRESPWPEYGFDRFADAIVGVNLAARGLATATTAAAAEGLASEVERLKTISTGLLEPLAARLDDARSQARARVAQRVVEGDEAALDTLDIALGRDESVAPEERFVPWVRRKRGANEAADAQVQANFPAWRHRRHHLQSMLDERLEEAGFSEALAAYDRAAFRAEHERAWPNPGPPHGMDAFASAVRPYLPPPANWLETKAADVVRAQARYGKTLHELDELLAGFAAPDTVDLRVELLDAYDELNRKADDLAGVLGLTLSLDYGRPPMPVEVRLGWLRVLIRLQERLDHMREASAESMAEWRPFHGQPFNQKENDLFQARLQPVLGANRGVDRIAGEIKRMLDGDVPMDDSFMADAVADIPAAGELEKRVRQSQWLGEAIGENGEAWAASVHEFLDDNLELQYQVIAASLRLELDVWHSALRALQLAVDGRRTSGGDGADWGAPAAIAVDLRRHVTQTTRRLDAIRTEAAAQIADLIRPFTERLQQLPTSAEALETGSAAALLTIDESLAQLRGIDSRLHPMGRFDAERLLAPRSAGLPLQARVAARNRAGHIARHWERKAVNLFLDTLDTDDNETRAQAIFAWRAALAIRLSPIMIGDVRGRLLRLRGQPTAVDRHWLVTEFEESQRLPLPRRHRKHTEDYYQRLKGAFREHPHTR